MINAFHRIAKYGFPFIVVFLVASFGISISAYFMAGFVAALVALYPAFMLTSMFAGFVKAYYKYNPRIYRPPGQGWRSILMLVITKKKFNEVYGQTFADAHEEYAEALMSNDLREARKIVFWLNLDIMRVLLLQVSLAPMTLISKAWAAVSK